MEVRVPWRPVARVEVDVRLPHVVLLAGVLAAVPAASASAQGDRSLQVGALIRISGLDVPNSPLVGLFAGSLGDTVLLGVPEGIEALRIPRSAITHLELQFGRRSGAGRASKVGILAGIATGVALTVAFRNELNRAEAGGVVIGSGAAGSIVGGLVGWMIFRQARWVEAPVGMLDGVTGGT